MATPNYNYEKRQRELAKKKKKEEKLKEREARKNSPEGEFGQNPDMGPDHSQNPDGVLPSDNPDQV
ncbi:MAG: hypothetical protein RLZZ457_487 [Pseudomonadota bacterium]|jgi:hypothetical protein